MLMELPRNSTLKIGSLGCFDFPAGYYGYIGSAQGGLEQRLSRHMRREKKKRWHIDYLLAEAEVVSKLIIPFGGREMECIVARTLRGVEGAQVVAEGFGSSDCRCESHLLYLGSSEDVPRTLEEVLFRLCTVESVYPYSIGQ